MNAEEIEELERQNRKELDRLNAKPWRGACPFCPGRLWCTDTEEEATRLLGEHMAEKHVILPMVWRDHE